MVSTVIPFTVLPDEENILKIVSTLVNKKYNMAKEQL